MTRVCASFDADVVIVQEDWAAADEPSLAHQVANALGDQVVVHTLATGRRTSPHPSPAAGWRPWYWYRSPSHILYLDGERPLSWRCPAPPGHLASTPGAGASPS